MDKRWTLAAVFALAGCSAPPVPGAFYLRDAPPAPAYVVTRTGAAFATSPLPQAQVIASVGPAGPTFGRLLGFSGALAAVEVGEPARQQQGQLNHCVNALSVPPGLRLVLWVPRDYLVPVLRQPLQHRYADGTGYDLAPGLPLGPAVAAGKQHDSYFRPLQTDRFLSAAEVPDDAVGLTYQPAPLPRAETESAEQWLETRTLPLGPGQLLRRPPASDPLWSGQVLVDPADPSQRLVGLQDRCARFVVRLPAQALGKPVDAIGIGALGERTPQLRADAMLFWPDGAEAGRSLRDTWVGRALPPRGQRNCFALALFPSGGPQGAKALRPLQPGEVEVCVDRQALLESTPSG